MRKLVIENIAIKKQPMKADFDYKLLYSDSRGAIFKTEYKALISEAIQKGIITIEKFIISEDAEDELFHIIETKGIQQRLLNRLKQHYNEYEDSVASLIYVLKKLDPDFTISIKEDRLKVDSNLFEIRIRTRIDGKNAEPRLFIENEKIALTSTNDDVGNLGDILAVRGIDVYAIGTDHLLKTVNAYRISRKDRYFDVAETFKDDIRPDLFKHE